MGKSIWDKVFEYLRNPSNSSILDDDPDNDGRDVSHLDDNLDDEFDDDFDDEDDVDDNEDEDADDYFADLDDEDDDL